MVESVRHSVGMSKKDSMSRLFVTSLFNVSTRLRLMALECHPNGIIVEFQYQSRATHDRVFFAFSVVSHPIQRGNNEK